MNVAAVYAFYVLIFFICHTASFNSGKKSSTENKFYSQNGQINAGIFFSYLKHKWKFDSGTSINYFLPFKVSIFSILRFRSNINV